jgi:hypothetical protein
MAAPRDGRRRSQPLVDVLTVVFGGGGLGVVSGYQL